MDNPIRRGEQRSGTPPQGGFSTGLRILETILNWLTGLMRLTEEEQKDAGIYLGHQTHK